MTESSPPTHPMVPVPDALRTVLKSTAKARLQQSPTPIRIDVSDWSKLLNRTLDSDVIMQEPGYPNYNASIMDGYAICTSDTFTATNDDGEERWTHAVVDRIHAGAAQEEESGDNKKPRVDDALQSQQQHELPQAFYITTGAVVPDGCDCVVPIEVCRVSSSKNEKYIAISNEATIQEGKWIRKVGCDMAAGSVVLERGQVLDSVAIGLLLQSGVKHVDVKPRIRVGVLSTGNELIGPGEDGDGVGRIPDVNRPILLSLLESFGNAVAIDLGMERDDDIDSLTSTIQNAFEQCDVIITTGGISMGETDVVEEVLVSRLGGTLHFGRMHMKPGKPTTFVTIGEPSKLVFAMPGNPVSATVCTHLLVRPALDLLYHGPDESADSHGESMDEMLDRIVSNSWVHPEVSATLTHDITLDTERPEYRRVTLTRNGEQILASSTGVQRSSRLQSLRDAQGFMLLPQGGPVSGKTVAKAGEAYTVLLLNDDVPTRRVQVYNSFHLSGRRRKEFNVGIMRVALPNEDAEKSSKQLEDLSSVVCDSLSGTRSGVANIGSSNSYCGSPKDLFNSVVACAKDDVDIYVVCYASFAFQRNLEIASCLRARLDKVAETMALQARRGAASQVPASAIFEVVAGYSSLLGTKGAMLIFLSEVGLSGGLQNVRGLLKHALKVGRSQPK